jgi:hypothetical protein
LALLKNFLAKPIFLRMCSMKFLVFALSLFWLSTTSIAASYEISGVAIGQPFADQRTRIQKINPAYKFSDIKTRDGQTSGLIATATRPDSLPIDQFVVTHTEAGQVWFVSRMQRFEPGSRINFDTLLKLLKEKYGPYVLNAATGFPEWHLDRQGNLFVPKSFGDLGPCRALAAFGPTGGNSVRVPTSFQPKCGTSISTQIEKDRDGMVTSFIVDVLDSQRIFDELDAKSKSKEQQKKDALDAEKAKDTRPKL